MSEDTAALQNQLVKEFWTKHPQFPGGTQAAQKMTERVQKLVDGYMPGMGRQPLSSDTLDLAYRQLLQEGELFSEKAAYELSEADLLQVVRDSGAEI